MAPRRGHALDFGVQRDTAKLRSRVGGTVFNGSTRLEALYAQDTWRINEDWKAMLGLRAERWTAFDGKLSGVPFGERRENSTSPKAALSWRANEL
ncbi:TonB-dependent receptor domain-containing protein [Pseudoduganella sp. UC29_106]|uniref:TonB-dependent receptor domain-containing protein n=1 Tax=Pseudoduganella sp. UC29_106 TaxID=3374553 RepID=UPI003756E507